MDFQPFASPLLENAVNEFAKLPGIGRKTALRLVLHLLRQDESVAESFGNAVIRLRREVHYCNVCHNISDTETCALCSDPSRDANDHLRSRKHQRSDGYREYTAISGAVSCLGRNYFSYGRDRPFGHRNRKSGGTCRCRRGKRGDSGTESHDGRRHDQLLHIPQAGTLSRQGLDSRAGSLYRRRTRIYR